MREDPEQDPVAKARQDAQHYRYDQAVEQIRRHPTFATIANAGKASVVFEQAQLGYYAFPARER
jgi:hypothetical protein